MLRFGLLICVCLFFLGCALLFAFGSAGSPCLLHAQQEKGVATKPGFRGSTLSAQKVYLHIAHRGKQLVVVRKQKDS